MGLRSSEENAALLKSGEISSDILHPSWFWGPSALILDYSDAGGRILYGPCRHEKFCIPAMDLAHWKQGATVSHAFALVL